MQKLIRYIRLCISYCLFLLFVFVGWEHETFLYLLGQAKGQLHVLTSTQALLEYAQKEERTQLEKENIDLIEKVKKYSCDSLAYLPTGNFTTVYDQHNAPVLWVITASEALALKAYYWTFPIVGKVNYKGFFNKETALKEANKLRCQNYDVDLRSVSAWSTLGWFSDPLMSGMLQRSKADLCDLLFHELFHATCYLPGKVDFNENVASFIARKATQKYLKEDTMALRLYEERRLDRECVNHFVMKSSSELRFYYDSIKELKNARELKLLKIYQISEKLKKLPIKNASLIDYHRRSMLEQKNAYFIDFEQYDSMQDSLEHVFNKFYKGDLKKLVQDLKQNQTIITFDN